MLILILGVFIVFTLISTGYLYFDIYRPLNTHYSAMVSILSDIHETLISKTLKINAIFFILISVGTLIIGIVFTHRVVGPLHRVKLSAMAVAKGKLDTVITFRKKDAIQPFAGVFNEMTTVYGNKISELGSEIRKLKEELTRLESSVKKGKATELDLKKVLEVEEKIKDLLSGIKL